MGWTKALFGRLTTLWSSSKKSSSESSSSSSYTPVFAVDRTEVAVATTAASATGVPELTLRELNKATQSFSAAMLIGRGHNEATAVYRATLPIGIGNNVKAADAVAKKMRYPPSRSRGTWSASDDEFLRQQVVVLSRLRHDNIVRLLGYTIDSTAGVRVLLFEFARMGTLHDVLHGPTGEQAAAAAEPPSSSSSRAALSWSQRTGIALDVARGLEYLHDAAAVSHWGITSTNVLLFHGFRAKIADYDLFMQRPLPQEEEQAKNNAFSRLRTGYDPPEYLMLGHRSSQKFDVYSYGILLLELLTGSNPNRRCRATPPLLEWAPPLVRQGRVEGFMDPKLGTRYPPDRALKLARIALCCLEKKPRSRPSMGDVAQMISCQVVSSESSMAR